MSQSSSARGGNAPTRVVKVSISKAKSDFSHVLRLARRSDVAISRGRRIVAYVVAAERYRQLVFRARKHARREQSEVFALARRLLAAPGGGSQSPVDERLVRLMGLFACAVHTLEDFDYATEWLREPNQRLGNRTPREVAETEGGAQRILDVLTAIDYGLPT